MESHDENVEQVVQVAFSRIVDKWSFDLYEIPELCKGCSKLATCEIAERMGTSKFRRWFMSMAKLN